MRSAHSLRRHWAPTSARGGSWPRYYDSLKLFSTARFSGLPGLPFPGVPDRYPGRDEVVHYLRSYAAHFDLPLELSTRVDTIELADRLFHVRTQHATYQ